MTKHKFVGINSLTAEGKEVFECANCNRKTANAKDRTKCVRPSYAAMLDAAKIRYKQSNYQFFNQKHEKPNDAFRFPYKSKP